jgi:hypothetical protein
VLALRGARVKDVLRVWALAPAQTLNCGIAFVLDRKSSSCESLDPRGLALLECQVVVH